MNDAKHTPGTMYVIASLKHTIRQHAHITFWAPDHCGYRLALTEESVGLYTEMEARQLNDGIDCIAVPWESVKLLFSPEPYFRNYKGEAARFYDTPGPVVDNTRANWDALIAASLPRNPAVKAKPEVFTGKRRTFSIAKATSQQGGAA